MRAWCIVELQNASVAHSQCANLADVYANERSWQLLAALGSNRKILDVVCEKRKGKLFLIDVYEDAPSNRICIWGV